MLNSLPHQTNLTQDGWIEVICGCMFSGKSTEGGKRITKELIAKNRRPHIFIPREAKREVTIFETGETINTEGKMVSRTGKTFEATEFDQNNPSQILTFIRQLDKMPTTVIVEEAHFCNNSLVDICKELAETFHLRVIVIGLDQTFDDKGFGPIPALMVEAEFITKELAVCTECGSQNASKSWLDSRAREKLDGKVLVGDKQYLALCRHCKNKFKNQFNS